MSKIIDGCKRIINAIHKDESQSRSGKPYDIGMVGWWFASNYGSSLTYYALCSVLEEMNKRVLLVPIAKPNGTPWEPEIKQTVDFMKRHFDVGEDKPFDEMYSFNDLCNSFMLGSDQMWTPGALNLVGYTFFLDFVDKNIKKIAFSTSFGHGDFNADKEACATVRDYLNRFDAISVREKSGIDVCKNRFGIDVQQIFDPVFMCDRKKYDVLADSVQEELPKKYLLCYILDPTPEKEAAAKAIAERNGCEIITILGMKEYAHAINNWHTGTVLPKVSAEQFLYYIKNSDFLLTDSHHGTCFGIIYHKQYAALVNASRGKTRFTTVAETLGLMDRLFDNPLDAAKSDSIYNPIDYAEVDKNLAREKENAYKWLKNALSMPSKVNNDTPYTTAADALRNSKPLMDAMNKSPDFVRVRMLATLLRDYGIKHVVLSPGGRDVPIIRMFEYNDNQFTLHRVTDERSACYYGLGIAAQLKQPVACICTSGTAASNYLPAVTEAYYTGVPLIVITADRREVFLNQGEDQTIPQKDIYRNVVKKAISLSEGSGFYPEYQNRRDIQDCILEATHNGYGPVHINIPIENISIGANAPRHLWKLLPRVNPHIMRVSPSDGDGEMMRWVNALKGSNRILVVYGQNYQPTEAQKRNIEAFASKYNCAIVTDHISNLNCAYALRPHNMLLNLSQSDFNSKLSPDILITVGGKRLMNDPLTAKVRNGLWNIRHWSVTPDGCVKDFYFRLSSVIETNQDYFFEWFAKHAGDISNNGVYFDAWKQLTEKHVSPNITNYNSLFVQSKFLPAVPANSILHLGVGQSFFECRRFNIDKSVSVFCNMGTNGIDGCTSTFMGQCAVAKDKLCFLLVGDLSFFYDMNSLWNKPLHKNMRILMVNNNGTGLLRNHNLRGVSSVHNTEAKNWVESTGFEYICARSKEEYTEKLAYFISDKPQKALFFEVFCD